MPMLSRTEVGLVIAIWGQAWVRGADGSFRALKLGDTLQKGTLVLTAQDAIVQITREGAADATDGAVVATHKADTLDADRAIEGINRGSADAAPAAGLGGGDAGGLTPGFRVDRIAELAPGSALSRPAVGPDELAPPVLLSGHAVEQARTQTITEPPTTV